MRRVTAAAMAVELADDFLDLSRRRCPQYAENFSSRATEAFAGNWAVPHGSDVESSEVTEYERRAVQNNSLSLFVDFYTSVDDGS